MDEPKHNECQQVRELLSELAETHPSDIDSSKATDGENARKHMEDCSPCHQWMVQTTELVSMAQALPQFDVSEGLTQSIMREVELVDKARQSQLTWLVYGTAVALFLFATLFVDAYESIWGIGSWFVGLGTMIVLQKLIAEPKQERQVI